MSLVEALWRMGDLERELVKAQNLSRQLGRKILPPFGALLVVPEQNRADALQLAEVLGEALVSAGAYLGKIERELNALHCLR